MDFGVTEEQTELAGLTRKILAEREAPWGDLATAGVLAAGLPAELGGAGLGLLEQCSVLIELGRAVSDVPYLGSIVLGDRESTRLHSRHCPISYAGLC